MALLVSSLFASTFASSTFPSERPLESLLSMMISVHLKSNKKSQKVKREDQIEERRKVDNHQALPDLLSFASILDASRHIRDTVFQAVGQALQTIADSLGASGVIDGLTKTAARSAYEATSSA
jgi:hypothetical protein